jgi:hypothetical protein
MNAEGFVWVARLGYSHSSIPARRLHRESRSGPSQPTKRSHLWRTASGRLIHNDFSRRPTEGFRTQRWGPVPIHATCLRAASLSVPGANRCHCPSPSAILLFLLLQQFLLGPKPVLFVATSLLRLGDQVCPFGDPLPRKRLARDRGITFPCVGPFFALFCEVGIVFHCSPLDRANLGATVVRCSCNPSLGYTGTRSRLVSLIIGRRRPTPICADGRYELVA